MAKCRDERAAFGWPGIEPRWTYPDKDGFGTAYAISSRIWFTLLNGVLTEIYYPTVDRATDGNVALPGELALEGRTMFTLGLALGESLHNAVTTLLQSLDLPFTAQRGYRRRAPSNPIVRIRRQGSIDSF